MLIDTSQHGNNLSVSYIAEDGHIKLQEFDIRDVNGFGSYDYAICDASDPDVEPVLRHFKDDLPIKRISSWRLDFDEKREFLTQSIPEPLRDQIFAFRQPELYMVDVEIDIKDGEIFPSPQQAAFPIDSIQITAPNLRTVTLTTNSRAMQDDQQIAHIENLVNEHYKDADWVWAQVERLAYSHIKFDTEAEMLNYFWSLVNKKLHCIAFWNGARFDVPYLNNRCPKIGVDMAQGSPTGEMSDFNKWPKHRYVMDYMQLVEKWGWDLAPLLSVGLDYVTKKIFPVGKVDYEGSYKDLYDGPIDRFLLYGAVDTINMQIIHKKKNYTAAIDSLVFRTKTSLWDSTKVTAQVHALCWDELYEDNKINGEPFVKKEKTSFEGGYVKSPTRKFVMFGVCSDFSALYPRLMQSYNMSFENFIGKVESKEHKEELIKTGFYVSVLGNYYKNDKDYTLKRIENKMLSARYAYKDLMLNIYRDALGPIEQELSKRSLRIPKD